MYSFGRKRSYGEKATQQATRERVAPIQTVILSEKQLEDLTDLIYNQIARNLGFQQRRKAPDLKPFTETKLLALDQFGRWSRAPPGTKENIQLIPEPSSTRSGKTRKQPSRSPSPTIEKEPEKKHEIESVLTSPCQGEISSHQFKQEEHVPEAVCGHNFDQIKPKEEEKSEEALVIHKKSPETLIEQGGFIRTLSYSLIKPLVCVQFDLMEHLRFFKGLQNLVFEPGGTSYEFRGVDNTLVQIGSQDIGSRKSLEEQPSIIQARSSGVDKAKFRDDPRLKSEYGDHCTRPPDQELHASLLTKTHGENQPERIKDIGIFLGAYLPNQKELSYKSTCSRNSTHQGIFKKKNWFKIFSHEEDIQLPSWRTSSESEENQRQLIEAFRSKQDETSCKPNCFGNLTHQRYGENWIHCKIHQGLKVIQLLNQRIPSWPYLQNHGFKGLQRRVWRPGEVYSHSEGSTNHPEGSYIILEGSDLRTNPFKGGGDGVIWISLYFRDMKTNTEPARVGLHGSGSSKENIPTTQEAEYDQAHVFIVWRRGLLTKAKAKTQKDHNDIMDKPKREWAEQSPFWPNRLKDRPPWASTSGLGRGL